MKIAHLLILWWLCWLEPPTPLYDLENEKGGGRRRGGGERQEKGRGGEITTPNKRLPCSQCEKSDLQVAAR